MNKETYKALKRIIKHIKRYVTDEDIEDIEDDIIQVSDWIMDTEEHK